MLWSYRFVLEGCVYSYRLYKRARVARLAIFIYPFTQKNSPKYGAILFDMLFVIFDLLSYLIILLPFAVASYDLRTLRYGMMGWQLPPVTVPVSLLLAVRSHALQ